MMVPPASVSEPVALRLTLVSSMVSVMFAVPVMAVDCVAVFPLSVKLSLPSYTLSSVVWTETLNVVVLAGTSTLKLPSSLTVTVWVLPSW
ncbi:hypothetical protein VCSRO132_2264 [Vibrio cholerae]|nr:hypothetical protein VCSRO152_2395 [Vibrio cholerae]GHY54978.1 hypothetical protein VCSRO166_2351 [Vibrio cholerae]GHY79428.1 hypothetical protein VCSRO169_1451 [Vibrio cholerae]GHZ09403.1 hypothetical protein VCSRO171_1872 [Vibrio cholerae]GHZ49082.1 hypothetical protein VCSRO125_2527 [Vibrio cholerae]